MTLTETWCLKSKWVIQYNQMPTCISIENFWTLRYSSKSLVTSLRLDGLKSSMCLSLEHFILLFNIKLAVFIKKETLKKHISCTFVWVTQEKFKLTCSCLKLISIFYLTLSKSSFQIHNVKWTSWNETEYNLHFLFRPISDISDQFFAN